MVIITILVRENIMSTHHVPGIGLGSLRFLAHLILFHVTLRGQCPCFPHLQMRELRHGESVSPAHVRGRSRIHEEAG